MPTTYNWKPNDFRAGHSCTTQLITVTEDILHVLDQKKQVDIMQLDFTKAFDTSYDIRNNIFNRIKTWLINYVLLNGESSTSVTVSSGVPQGTILGPFMSLLYINDITRNTG